MSQPVAFILNRGAGGSHGADWLDANRSAVEAVAGDGPVSVIDDGRQIGAAVDRALALGCDTVVAGGGDGTLNAVASRLVGKAARFGVLPLGTLNHFAKDMGIPLDPSAALRNIAEGHTTQVDVGEVNGHFFLNNSSLGLYVDIVRDRERQQLQQGRGKWPAFASALWGAMRRYPFMTVNLTLQGHRSAHRTPFVFVGNNAYETQGLQMGQRSGMREGALSVYVAEHAGRRRLVALAVRALFSRLQQADDFRVFTAPELRIDTRHHHLRVAIDGEVRRLDTPLHYRIHARALHVIVPASASIG